MSEVITKTRKPRCCSKCGKPGHTKNKCTAETRPTTEPLVNVFEENTDLSTEYTCVNPDDPDEVVFTRDTNKRHYLRKDKQKFYEYMRSIGEVYLEPEDIAPCCSEPDEVYIDTDNKICYIIEKNNQSKPGVNKEKILAAGFKRYHYRHIIPNYTVHNVYCLSDWFKHRRQQSNIEYLEYKRIAYFWGEDIDYKELIVRFMCE